MGVGVALGVCIILIEYYSESANPFLLKRVAALI